jgi:hypothetical protein
MSCQVEWCDQSAEREHMVHEQTALTLVATGGSWGSQRPMTVQLIVAGTSDETARPVLALVDGQLEQQSVGLSWTQAHQLANQIIGEYARHRRRTIPQ